MNRGGGGCGQQGDCSSWHLGRRAEVVGADGAVTVSRYLDGSVDDWRVGVYSAVQKCATTCKLKCHHAVDLHRLLPFSLKGKRMTSEEFSKKVGEVLRSQQVETVKPEEGIFAAHYSKAYLPNTLLSAADKNKIRQYDGDYMNDPEEGRYLVDVMIRAAKQSNHRCASAFVEKFAKLRSARLLYAAYRKCTVLSCWTTTYIKAGREDASDSLNHWRFYGDDGKGACVMVPLEKLVVVFPEQLYRVSYGTEARGGGSGASGRPVKVIEQALIARLNALRKTPVNAMEELDELIQAVHPLLFLFKSDEYSSEMEIRSIVHKGDYSSGKSGVLFDEQVPKRAFVDSSSGLISEGSIVYYGPKADHAYAIELMGSAANLGLDLQVYVSTMPYR